MHIHSHTSLIFIDLIILCNLQIEESVRSMVMRYGSRLWKLRVLQAELKINIRLTPTGKQIPIRLFLTNESGYYLDISLYKEVTDSRTGQVGPKDRQVGHSYIFHLICILSSHKQRASASSWKPQFIEFSLPISLFKLKMEFLIFTLQNINVLAGGKLV